jgi:hypothetical protein
LYTGDVIKANWKDRLHWEEAVGLQDADSRQEAVIGDARIMVLHPGSMDVHPIFEGLIKINGIHYNVLTKEHYAKVKTHNDVAADEFGEMIVFRNADAWHDNAALLATDQHVIQTPKCNHDTLPFNSNVSHPIWSAFAQDDMLRTIFKRDDLGGMAPSTNYRDSIGNSQGCPSTQQVVYMGVAIDCNYVQTYGSTERAREQVLNVWNQVSAVYRSTFNISLGIGELVVQNLTCPSQAIQGTEWDVSCDQSLTLDQRLSLFSQWRGNRGDDGIGLWHLMSACPTVSCLLCSLCNMLTAGYGGRSGMARHALPNYEQLPKRIIRFRNRYIHRYPNRVEPGSSRGWPWVSARSAPGRVLV